jgi:hypothetical protein
LVASDGEINDVISVECIACFEPTLGSPLNLKLVYKKLFTGHRGRKFFERKALYTCQFERTGSKYVIFDNECDKRDPDCEERQFKLGAGTVRTFRDKVFKDVKSKEVSLFEALMVMYAACGVNYEEYIDGHMDSIAARTGWLEHYSRVLCGCPNEKDSGYQTEEGDNGEGSSGCSSDDYDDDDDDDY